MCGVNILSIETFRGRESMVTWVIEVSELISEVRFDLRGHLGAREAMFRDKNEKRLLYHVSINSMFLKSMVFLIFTSG